jgi:hypothetical protein
MVAGNIGAVEARSAQLNLEKKVACHLLGRLIPLS